MFQFVIHFCTDDISRGRIVKMVVYINKALEIEHSNRFNPFLKWRQTYPASLADSYKIEEFTQFNVLWVEFP